MGLLFWTALASIVRDTRNKGAFGEMIVTSMFTSKFFGEEERYLINDLYFERNGVTHQVDHILIYHKGIFVIETKHLSGITIGNLEDQHWQSIINNNSYDLYNPVLQNNTHCEVVAKFLNGKYKVYSIIVFTNENKPQDIPAPVINFSELKDYIINYPKNDNLSSEEMQNLDLKLKDYKENCTITSSEHIASLQDKHGK